MVKETKFTTNPCGGTVPEQGEAVNLRKESDELNEILASVESINLSTVMNYVCEIKLHKAWLLEFYHKLQTKPTHIVMNSIDIKYINEFWFICLQQVIDYFSNNSNPDGYSYELHIDDSVEDRIGIY